MKKFKKGFTLTELMISLTVIGIIIAVVTPAIMRTRPNKNKMMIKKAYYTTENIVSNLINDHRLYPDMTEACEADFVNDTGDTSVYCAWGFDYDESVTFEGKAYSGAVKFQKLFASKLNLNSYDNTNYSKFTTADGVTWDFTGVQGAWTPKKTTGPEYAGTGVLLVDVNGSIGPNCLEKACADPEDFDQFRINIMANGKMSIHDDDERAKDYITVNAQIVH